MEDTRDGQTPQTYEDRKLYILPIDQIRTDPNQPRQHFDQDALKALANSIKTVDVLQPILVRKNEEGTIFVVAGERRLKASKMAGKNEIPAIFMSGKHEEIAIIENVLRENLTVIEESESIDRLKKTYDYTDKQLGELLGKKRNTISEMLVVLDLPKDILDECRGDPNCSRAALLRIQRSKQQAKGKVTLFRKLKDSGELYGEKKKKGTVPTKTIPNLPAYQATTLKNTLGKLDPKGLDTEVREKLKTELNKLSLQINEILKNL